MNETAIYKRANEICRIFSIGRSTLYKWAKDPNFPKPIKAGPKVTLWDVKAIEEYFKKKTAEVDDGC